MLVGNGDEGVVAVVEAASGTTAMAALLHRRADTLQAFLYGPVHPFCRAHLRDRGVLRGVLEN